MIRRTFLTASSIVLAGISAKTSTIIPWVQQSPELLPKEKKELVKFRAQIEKNLQNYPNAEKLAYKISTPVKILDRIHNEGSHRLVFTSEEGSIITLKLKSGVSSIYVS